MTEIEKSITFLITQFCKQLGMDDKIKSYSDQMIDQMAIDMVVNKIPKSFCTSHMTEFVEQTSSEIMEYCGQIFDMNDVVNFLTIKQMHNEEVKVSAFNQFIDQVLKKNSESTLANYKQEVLLATK